MIVSVAPQLSQESYDFESDPMYDFTKNSTNFGELT